MKLYVRDEGYDGAFICFASSPSEAVEKYVKKYYDPTDTFADLRKWPPHWSSFDEYEISEDTIIDMVGI